MYHDGSRQLQDQFNTRKLADLLAECLARGAFSDEDRLFIESRPLFFLATADAEGNSLGLIYIRKPHTMFDALKRLLGEPANRQPDEQQGVQQAIAALLHEMSRIDSQMLAEESSAARAALGDLCGMTDERARDLLHEAAAPANRLTSYHEPLSAINRVFDPATKIRLVEHLWHVAFADSTLDPHEDHLVRKISDLLYVPHVQCMLARQRARDGGAAKS